MTEALRDAAAQLSLRIAESPEYISLRLAEENDPAGVPRALDAYRALIREINAQMEQLLGAAPSPCGACTGCGGRANQLPTEARG